MCNIIPLCMKRAVLVFAVKTFHNKIMIFFTVRFS